MNNDTKQRSVYIPDDVWQAARVKSVSMGMSTSNYVLGAIVHDLAMTGVTVDSDSVTTSEPINPIRHNLDKVEIPNETIRPVAER